jgi:hypothetical protein
MSHGVSCVRVLRAVCAVGAGWVWVRRGTDGGVDDVLAIAAHDDEATVGVVLQGLREDLHGAHVLGGQSQALAVHDLGVCP